MRSRGILNFKNALISWRSLSTAIHASTCLPHSWRTRPFSIRGHVDRTLCYTFPGNTSGESVQERSVAHPFLTATVIALLSLPLVLLEYLPFPVLSLNQKKLSAQKRARARSEPGTSSPGGSQL